MSKNIYSNKSRHLTEKIKSRTRNDKKNQKGKLGTKLKSSLGSLLNNINHKIKWRNKQMTDKNCPLLLKFAIYKSTLLRSQRVIQLYTKLGAERTKQCLPYNSTSIFCQIMFRHYRKRLLQINGSRTLVNFIIHNQKIKIAQLFSFVNYSRIQSVKNRGKFPERKQYEGKPAFLLRREQKFKKTTELNLKQMCISVKNIQDHNFIAMISKNPYPSYFQQSDQQSDCQNSNNQFYQVTQREVQQKKQNMLNAIEQIGYKAYDIKISKKCTKENEQNEQYEQGQIKRQNKHNRKILTEKMSKNQIGKNQNKQKTKILNTIRAVFDRQIQQEIRFYRGKYFQNPNENLIEQINDLDTNDEYLLEIKKIYAGAINIPSLESQSCLSISSDEQISKNILFDGENLSDGIFLIQPSPQIMRMSQQTPELRQSTNGNFLDQSLDLSDNQQQRKVEQKTQIQNSNVFYYKELNESFLIDEEFSFFEP